MKDQSLKELEFKGSKEKEEEVFFKISLLKHNQILLK